MKIKDLIIAAGNRTDWIHFDNRWYITMNGKIVLAQMTKYEYDIEDEVTVHYNWYHHFNSSINIQELSDSIINHDYNTFLKWYNKLSHYYQSLMYLPDTASIFLGDTCIGSICIAHSPEVFSLITDEDHECG